MAEKHERTRLYGEKEIGILIQRATELQKDARESSERGLTLQEVEQIAVEIGIDPAYLRIAAADVGSIRDGDRGFRFWGGPFLLEERRVVEGTVSEAQWEQIVPALRRLTGSTGKTNEIGRTREWTRSIKDLNLLIEQTGVAITPREDQTTIEVRKQFRGGAFMAYSLSLIFSVTVAGIFLDGGSLPDLVNAAIVTGSGISGLAAARASMGIWTKRQREKVTRLTDWLHDHIAQPSTDTVANRQGADLLDLPEEEPEEEKMQAPGADSRRSIRV